MYPASIRNEATRLRDAGESWSGIARKLGVHRSTLRDWQAGRSARTNDCAICGPCELDEEAYAGLLGFYLGDGCVSRAARTYFLRVACDATQPGVIADVTDLIRRVRPEGRVFHPRAPGVTVVQSNWQHWPCLFPQHGPGRKHERPIVLEEWQRRIVKAHPASFLRGLFHSDGCRVINSTKRPVAGVMKEYRYPRWQFVNASGDIRELCCWALDLVGVAWRRSNPRVISVSRREAVEALDALIGLKS
ncbi:helix-turn-helix domain-containing protein [Nocardioides bizhenqiangii]|uniref:Transcriptional regulator n=1 Tax=Nocardioides bizhenqiangii TaxID=3095076 RepID=A0ABZ0ZKQ7_9ACTN|nr:helix-turn-helix domain-containing protein [Nocardioides sp. HM61]WQQ24958.1 transcriptional regulator [Nocardioides sp. HM61]